MPAFALKGARKNDAKFKEITQSFNYDNILGALAPFQNNLVCRYALLDTVRASDSRYKSAYLLSDSLDANTVIDMALANLQRNSQYQNSLADLGFDMEELINAERRASRHNDGIASVGAGLLESFSTHSIPALGYGPRYQDDLQRHGGLDQTDTLLSEFGISDVNLWEVRQHGLIVTVRFFGRTGGRSDALDSRK